MDNKRSRSRTNRSFPLLVIGLAIILLLGYLLWPEPSSPPEVVLPPPVIESEPTDDEPPPQVTEAPDIPRVEQPATAPSDDATAPPEPQVTLNDSDAEARELLTASTDSHPVATEWLTTDNLLRRGAMAVDILSRHQLPITALPVGQAQGSFQVDSDPESGRLLLDSTNFERYDPIVSAINAISSERLVSLFHYFRPLLEQAYTELGHPAENFDNALIAAIDHLLAAPVVDTPIELVHETVAYQYADERLESLPSSHRQLLRMGPEHTRTIQAKLRDIRQLLLGSLEED